MPAGWSAFRRTFTPLPGQIPAFALWVNGVEVGTGSNFRTARQYTVNFVSNPSEIAVSATNSAAGTAGVFSIAEISMMPSGRANCTAGASVLTGRIGSPVPSGWQLPTFDDSTWPAVGAEATYPAGPWGSITLAVPSPPIDV